MIRDGVGRRGGGKKGGRRKVKREWERLEKSATV